MKIAYRWLNEFIRLQETPEKIAEKLTATGLEVEGIEPFESIEGGLEGLCIGEVLTCGKHPDADKLSLTTVDIGAGEPLQIVCGAPNVAAGQKVIVATVGTTLYPKEGEPLKIKKGKIRGQVSMGMICAEDEIGLGTSHDGILVLDTNLPNGTPAAEYFSVEHDHIIEIGLTPNRVDAASHFGVARDLHALTGEALQKPDVSEFEVDNMKLPIRIQVENTEAAPRYSGLSLSGVKVAPSPTWLQNRLRSIGLEPINNIVDITNYVLHSFGQPLHAFDADKIADHTIRVKTLPKGTKFTTLDEKERNLAEDDLMICDGNDKPLCMAGVFGGLHSGISENTQNIFLESAYFSPEYIRRTGSRHELHTDAAYRFARGTDPNATVYALKYAAIMIKSLAGGTISSDVIDIYPQPIENFEFSVKYDYIDRLVGQPIPRQTVHTILSRLEIGAQSEGEAVKVSVPPYRVDVQQPADIVEEVLRIYGFNQIEIGTYLQTSYLADFPQKDPYFIKNRLAQTLSGLGFFEMMNNSLTSPRYAAALDASAQDVEMLQPLSEELKVMRQYMLFSGLESIARNINRKETNLRFFEFGYTYHKIDADYQQNSHLALFVTGLTHAASWHAPAREQDFYDLMGLVQRIFTHLNLTEVSKTTLQEDPIFDYGLAFYAGKTLLAKVGKVRRQLLALNEIQQPVFYADLDWEALLEASSLELTFEEPSRFPPVRRDLSLVVDKNVPFARIEELAQKTERKLLQSIDVFDVYEGDKIEAGKKAYAFRMVLQDKQKTLNDKTIDKTMQKLMRTFEQELEAVIRK
ncbi:MAG: phenylalanine--tRNA ligase subunit beta [Bernardetiaceae bacterium]|nr:phenylalanine--tRNA ligase subunit beta [Bernardetiaceae bacterium]